ncbi:MAG: ribonuclease [Ruminococcaceae bacterium]|nr:ribonuclease [Oscillospiraceae bacterium]
MKSIKRWLGLALAAVIIVAAVYQWLRPAQEPDEPAPNQQQETVLPGDEGDETPADPAQPEDGAGEDPAAQPETLPEAGTYTTRDDVALYLHLYGHLPGNFITKREAEKLGWPGGSLEPYAPGCCIGGDRFGNYEGSLPKKDGRSYKECDIDTLGTDSRGAKRIVYSNDGLIYYTEDHYNTFILLYGEEAG